MGEEGRGEVRTGKGGKGRDFGPSQCWRQIDAPGGLFATAELLVRQLYER